MSQRPPGCRPTTQDVVSHRLCTKCAWEGDSQFPMGLGIPWESMGMGIKHGIGEGGIANHLNGNGNYLHSHGNLFPHVLCCGKLITLSVGTSPVQSTTMHVESSAERRVDRRVPSLAVQSSRKILSKCEAGYTKMVLKNHIRNQEFFGFRLQCIIVEYSISAPSTQYVSKTNSQTWFTAVNPLTPTVAIWLQL